VVSFLMVPKEGCVCAGVSKGKVQVDKGVGYSSSVI
jgi:hypothetical protein